MTLNLKRPRHLIERFDRFRFELDHAEMGRATTLSIRGRTVWPPLWAWPGWDWRTQPLAMLSTQWGALRPILAVTRVCPRGPLAPPRAIALALGSRKTRPCLATWRHPATGELGTIQRLVVLAGGRRGRTLSRRFRRSRPLRLALGSGEICWRERWRLLARGCWRRGRAGFMGGPITGDAVRQLPTAGRNIWLLARRAVDVVRGDGLGPIR